MTDELKPSPEAVRVWNDAFSTVLKSDGGHEAAALVIDRALRPATMPGDVVEAAQELEARAYTSYRARNGRMCSIEGDDGEQAFIVPNDAMMALRDALSRNQATTAMQPAIQAAVDALDAVEGAQINPTYGWNITALNKARPLVASALATLRTVTEQGEG